MKPAIDINRILKLNLFNSQDREEWLDTLNSVWSAAMDALRDGDIEKANARLDTFDQLIRHPKSVKFQECVKRLAKGRKQFIAFDDVCREYVFFEKICPSSDNDNQTNDKNDEQ